MQSNDEEYDSDYEAISDEYLGGLPCKKRMKYILTDQLKGMMKVDLIVARPGVDIRMIIDNFDLDICATYYDGRCCSVPHPLSAFVQTAYYQRSRRNNALR